MKSLLPSLVAIAAFIAGVVWMKEGPSIGLESLGKFFKASFVCFPIILIFGIIAIFFGREEMKKKDYVFVWILPVYLIFATPILVVLWWIGMSFLGSWGFL